MVTPLLLGWHVFARYELSSKIQNLFSMIKDTGKILTTESLQTQHWRNKGAHTKKNLVIQRLVMLALMKMT